MNLRSKLAITCAKATSALIKKLNRGSGVTLPGYVARLIDPKILSAMSGMVREKTIVTMGTNGKTTTNSILYHALKAEGKKVIINRTGSNMLNGIISAFVLATDKHRFEYAESILSSWKRQNVHHKSDIQGIDDKYQQRRRNAAPPAQKQSGNRFNQFKQNNYDFDALEQELISN